MSMKQEHNNIDPLLWDTLPDGRRVPSAILTDLHERDLLTRDQKRAVRDWMDECAGRIVVTEEEIAALTQEYYLTEEGVPGDQEWDGSRISLLRFHVDALLRRFVQAMAGWNYGPQSLSGLTLASRSSGVGVVGQQGSKSLDLVKALPALRALVRQLELELAGKQVDLSQLEEMLNWLESVLEAQLTTEAVAEVSPCLAAMQQYLGEAAPDWRAMGGKSCDALVELAHRMTLEANN